MSLSFKVVSPVTSKVEPKVVAPPTTRSACKVALPLVFKIPPIHTSLAIPTPPDTTKAPEDILVAFVTFVIFTTPEMSASEFKAVLPPTVRVFAIVTAPVKVDAPVTCKAFSKTALSFKVVTPLTVKSLFKVVSSSTSKVDCKVASPLTLIRSPTQRDLAIPTPPATCNAPVVGLVASVAFEIFTMPIIVAP